MNYRLLRTLCVLKLLILFGIGMASNASADEWDDLFRRAAALRGAAKYNEAEQLLRQRLETGGGLRDRPILFAQLLELFGNVCSDLSKYKEAEKLYERALEILEKTPGAKPTDVANVVSDLGSANWDRGNYSRALTLFERSLAMREAAFGPDHENVARSLVNIGFVYNAQGKFAEAESYDRKALAIFEKKLGREHPYVAWTLTSLADQCAQQGRYDEAEPMHQRALRIRERAFSPDHPDIAFSLMNLGIMYQEQGKFSLAEQFHQRALRIREKAYGPVHDEVAMSLNLLATVYDDQGSYAAVEPLRQRVLQIYEKIHGADHPNIAIALHNLAVLYMNQAKYPEATKLFERALRINETALGPDHVDVALTLKCLGRVYRMQGKSADAIPLQKRAANIYEHSRGPNHPALADALNLLAALYTDQGRLVEAAPLIEQAMAILQKMNRDPGALIACYNNRAELNWKSGRRDRAVADLSHGLELLEALRSNVAGAEKDRADFLSSNSEYFERLIQWRLQLGQLNEALATVERGRSRTLLDQMKLQGADLLATLPSAQARRLKDRDTAARAKIASLEKELEILPNRQDFSDEQKRAEETRLNQQLSVARQEQIDAYREMHNASPAYRLMVGQNFKPVPLAQLQGWVKQQDALLLQYFLGDEAGYLFVIPAEGEPQVVKLEISKEQAAELGAEAGPLTAKRMKAALTIDAQDLPQKLSQAEHNPAVIQRLAALWKALVPTAQREALISGKYKSLILVPDGALVNLPFETLVLEPGEKPVYLLDRCPPIIAGPSATLLYNLVQRETAASNRSQKQPVLTIGNPNYPARPRAIARRENTSRSSAELMASFKPGARYATRGDLKPLPHSGTEVAWVAEAFSNIGLAADKLLRGDATEGRLRAAIAGREVIHLACHGLIDNEYGNFFGALALTPGSRADTNAADDGFLTLPEIYELNLKGCELAILSACQTNYGPQQRGEGVWALSRGFLVAGSRRVVASNWLVDDEAAASLVYHFCSVIAKQEKQAVDYAQALHEAKRTIRRQEKWQHPYYWATFTLLGPN